MNTETQQSKPCERCAELDLLLRDLLCVIHRDGGQHIRAHGIEQSVEDAKEKFFDLRDWSYIANELAGELCDAKQAVLKIKGGLWTVDETVAYIQRGIDRCLALKSQPAQPDPKDKALRLAKMALDEVLDLISESEGVFGLHLNGDLAPWGEIERGGFFERLSTLPEAIAAIDTLKGKQ